MALPHADNSFDVAVMALVLFFGPEPTKGVAEMRAVGVTPLLPPSIQASRVDRLRELWTGAGLTAIESRTITVSRRFANFDEFWTITPTGTAMREAIERMTPADAEQLKSRVQARLPADAAGRTLTKLWLTPSKAASWSEPRYVRRSGREGRRLLSAPRRITGPLSGFSLAGVTRRLVSGCCCRLFLGVRFRR